MVEKFTVKESSRIKALCEPLERYFGVNHFWYSRTSKEGWHFSLASNPEMHSYYHAEKLYLHSPFFRKPDLVQPGLYYYPSINDPKFQETIGQVASKANVALGAGFVLQDDEALVRIGYAIDPKRAISIIDVLFNNLELLCKFNEYFVKEAASLITKAEHEAIFLPDEMGTNYTLAPQGMKALLTADAKTQFLKAIGCLDKRAHVTLSKREKECLKHLLEGCTARGIAELMKLSIRTVENYLDTAKNKLDCFNKEELFQKARLLQISGLL